MGRWMKAALVGHKLRATPAMGMPPTYTPLDIAVSLRIPTSRGGDVFQAEDGQ